MLKSYVLPLFFVALSFYTYGQDLTNVNKKNWFKVNGSVGATQTFYHADGIANRRDPYFWMVNANVTFNIAGFAIPLSGTISQQNKSYSQPFNQVGISPKYKDLTVHAGFRSMNLSNYSLAGLLFLGGGVEYTPQKSWVKLYGMYGRLQKAVDDNASVNGTIAAKPAYERWGGGSKVVVGNGNNNLGLVLFKAKDKENSLSQTYFENGAQLKPAENLVIALTTTQKITKQLSVDGEYSFSAYNSDVRAPKVVIPEFTYIDNLGGVFNTNASSQFNKAITANANYRLNVVQFGVGYRRVDPEYKSLGATFLNNDFEDVTGRVSFKVLKGKINIGTQGGFQRNNLNNQLFTSMHRVIGSVNLSYSITQHLNLSTNYSNFNSSTNIQNVNGADSLNYSQITQSGGGNLTYSFGHKTNLKNNVMLNASTQQATSNLGKPTTFYNASAGYQANYVPQHLNTSLTINAFRNLSYGAETQSIGPGILVNKMWFKNKLRTGVNATYLNTFTNGTSDGSVVTNRLAISYNHNKHHSITSDISYLIRQKNSVTAGKTSFKELRASLVYVFTF